MSKGENPLVDIDFAAALGIGWGMICIESNEGDGDFRCDP